MSSPNFDYWVAFSRNLGWVTEAEQARLRSKRIAIAGLGGVGGAHLLTLTRLGIGSFHIADFDQFDWPNFNRQAGANVSTIGRPKVDVLIEMARAINPELDIMPFPAGVTAENMDSFLRGVDLYVDGLDFFAFTARESVFAACAQRGTPSITAAPLGMGTAVLNFMPGGITFADYFQLEGCSESEKALRFLVGLAPTGQQMRYLVDRSRVDLDARRGPSTVMACEMCAGVAATQALKILLGRGPVPAAPHSLHYDAYRNKLRRVWRPGGNRNPVQRVLLWLGERGMQMSTARLRGSESGSRVLETPVDPTVLEILKSAVLAPSADNHHDGRFEIKPNGFHIHASQRYLQNPYRHRRILSHISFGAIAENIALQAEQLGRRATFNWFPQGIAAPLIAEVLLDPAPAGTTADRHLASMIPHRHTNRRIPFSGPKLNPGELEKLSAQAAQVEQVSVLWPEDRALRARVLRLVRIAETERFKRPFLHDELFSSVRFDVGWRNSCSEGLPPAALEVEPGMRAMFATLRRWPLMRVLNLFGTHMLLGMRAGYVPCRLAPHLGVIATTLDPEQGGAIAVGRAFQRLWLQATLMGLSIQPFAASVVLPYENSGTGSSKQLRDKLVSGWQEIVPNSTPLMVFRLGKARAPSCTTERLSLDSYLVK